MPDVCLLHNMSGLKAQLILPCELQYVSYCVRAVTMKSVHVDTAD